MFTRVAIGDERGLGMPGPAVELFRVVGRGRTLGPMARHVRTPQLLAAMDGGRWGLWVAPPGAAPHDPTWIEVEVGEAILLDAGTWHRGPVPLDAPTGVYLTVEAPRTNVEDFEESAPVAGPPGARTG